MESVVIQASDPRMIKPSAAPIWPQRAPLVRTLLTVSDGSSSSVNQAASAPERKVHESPYNICVMTRSGKEVTSPVKSMADPISPCAMMMGLFQL